MWKWLMGRKLSTMVFNDPRAKTKTVLEMKCKKDSESSRFLAVSDSWCLLSQSNPTPVLSARPTMEVCARGRV